MNIITVEVQQITTRSKVNTAEWEEQDEIRKAAQEWMAKANTANVERMRQYATLATSDTIISTEVDLISETLADGPITLSMSNLLNLVPHFRQARESRLQKPHMVIPTLLTEHNHRPMVIDHQNPAINVLVQGT